MASARTGSYSSPEETLFSSSMCRQLLDGDKSRELLQMKFGYLTYAPLYGGRMQLPLKRLPDSSSFSLIRAG